MSAVSSLNVGKRAAESKPIVVANMIKREVILFTVKEERSQGRVETSKRLKDAAAQKIIVETSPRFNGQEESFLDGDGRLTKTGCPNLFNRVLETFFFLLDDVPRSHLPFFSASSSRVRHGPALQRRLFVIN